jgi:hypothetical protein
MSIHDLAKQPKTNMNLNTDYIHSSDQNDVHSGKSVPIHDNACVEQDATKMKLDILTTIITDLQPEAEKVRLKYYWPGITKQYLALLHFEDDTMRPVFVIRDSYLDIVHEWYRICDILVDIEKTNTYIPETIPYQKIKGIVFKDMHCKYRDEYLNTFLPMMISNITLEKSVKYYENVYFQTQQQESKETPRVQYDPLEKLKFQIPNNMKSEIMSSDMSTSQYSKGSPSFLYTKVDGILAFNESPFHLEGSFDRGLYLIDGVDPFTSEVSKKPLDINAPLLAYNEEYDVLHCPFSRNNKHFPMSDIDDKQKVSEVLTSIYVLINDKYLQCICIKNPSQDVLYVMNHHQEYGFIKLFSIQTSKQDLVQFMDREFHRVVFDNVEEVNKKLQLASEYIDFSNKHIVSASAALSEEQQVKHFLNLNFTLDKNIEHKMKASSLHEMVINSGVVSIEPDKLAGFKNRLSKYLKELGLEKKRFNDGFYYYGVVAKRDWRSSSNVTLPKVEIANMFFDLEKQREEDMNKYRIRIPYKL